MIAADTHRSAKERSTFVVALIISCFAWLAIVVTLVGLLYAPFIALGIVIGHALLLARITGNAVRVGSRQLPDVYRSVEKAAKTLGLEDVPEVYVITGGGILNAFATKLFSRKFVILNAEILDACEKIDEGREPGAPSAVDFIVGHEVGHLALGHLGWNWLLWPAQLVPLLGPAFMRAREYSCDACGLAVCGDVETSSRALAILAAGGNQAKKLSLEALIEQRHETGGFFMGLAELNSSHPYLSKRVAAVHRLRDGGVAPDVGRNPFSYILAPFFAMSAGGAGSILLVYAAVIGVMAAVAIPSFVAFQEKAKMAGSKSEDPFAALGALGDKNSGGENFESGGLGLKARDDNDDNDDGEEDAAARAATEKQIAELFGKALAESAQAGNEAAAAPPAEEPEEAAPQQPQQPRFEARLWLKGQLAAQNKGAISGLANTQSAAILVEKLYKAGAKNVSVTGVGVDVDGIFATDIVAVMPEKAVARKKLMDLCSAEYKKQGYDEPCEDGGGDEIFFNWQD